MCVRGLFQVIKHISTGLCVHELTSICQSKKCVIGKYVTLHEALVTATVHTSSQVDLGYKVKITNKESSYIAQFPVSGRVLYILFFAETI